MVRAHLSHLQWSTAAASTRRGWRRRSSSTSNTPLGARSTVSTSISQSGGGGLTGGRRTKRRWQGGGGGGGGGGGEWTQHDGGGRTELKWREGRRRGTASKACTTVLYHYCGQTVPSAPLTPFWIQSPSRSRRVQNARGASKKNT